MRFFWKTKNSKEGVLTHCLDWTYPQSCPENPPDPEHGISTKKQRYDLRLFFRTKRSASSAPSFNLLSSRHLFERALFAEKQRGAPEQSLRQVSLLGGSITVEAALVLPLFLCFCIQLISWINLLQLHSVLQAALHQETMKLALAEYGKKQLEEAADIDIVGEELAGALYLKNRITERVGRDYLEQSMIQGGSSGLQVRCREREEGGEIVEAVLYYRVVPALDILGFSGFLMWNRCKAKAWTGYQPQPIQAAGQGVEELVYLTETGSVYHKSRSCSHLLLSIREVKHSSVAVLRNENGGRYYPCEECGDRSGAVVFLTDQGTRYHSSFQCSGLKRTIYTVPISEAGGRAPCSRCSAMG